MPTLPAPGGPLRRSITPNGHAGTQYPQPLQMSSCTTTVPNSVRVREPVGQTSRQAACVQCLHTSDDINHRIPVAGDASMFWPGMASTIGSAVKPLPAVVRLGCSMNATCRQVLAPSAPVLSYDMPSISRPSSGMPFHSLHATSQALQPIQTELSVKNPL